MKHPVLAMLIAFALALGAGLIVYWYAAGADQRALATQSPVTVMVAAEEIPAGTTLGEAEAAGMITLSEVPDRLRPQGAMDPASASDHDLIASVDIPQGQFLLASSFGPNAPELAALDIPDGLMAVSVQLEDPAKVGAFLRPGSHVAVFDTFEPTTGQDQVTAERFTRPLLSDVTVLAIGTVPESGEESAAADSWTAPLVTLAVDQTQAERLVHAARTGQLYFALLGEGTDVRMSSGVSDSGLFE